MITLWSAADVADIHLPGEEEEEVPVYDTCDDIRRKITEHLKGTTQAAFTRDLTGMLLYSKVTTAHMTRFMKMKGPKAGGHSPLFYAAYVFFEKLRIKQGKKKRTVKRENLEGVWETKGGFPREGDHNLYLTTRDTETWWIDNLGVIQIGPRGRNDRAWHCY